MPMQNNAMQMY